MLKNKSYSGIDNFRLIAALLVVAIHTSPLLNYTPTGDYILTRVIARVAVPFFFMTSGFFLISRYGRDLNKLGRFVKKTVLIYCAAILLYLPVRIYTGYLRDDDLLPKIIKDIIFDGTMYHLWYLPASIIGAAIAWYLVRRFSYKTAFSFSAVLYIIGLFGDSYYGVAQSIPVISGFYDLLFQIMDYTRNGLFFAPIFFVTGAYISEEKSELSLKKAAFGFSLSFVFLLTEALLVRRFQVQRHDSMYIFLLPCMYFLFELLLHHRGKRRKELRNIALIIYIIHPLVIIAVRFLSKSIGLKYLFVDNNLVHFVTVAGISCAVAWLLSLLWDRFGPKKQKGTDGTDRAYLELDLNNLEHNVRVLREALPEGCELMAVVKAQAYGHGAFESAVVLSKLGISAYAVACIDEAIQLRKAGVKGDILILGYTSPLRANELHKYDLTQTLIDHAYAVSLNERGIKLKAHIKIDSGMHRLGYAPTETDRICEAFSMKNIEITGIFTHLSCADSLDESDVAFSHGQIDCFYGLLDKLKSRGIKLPKVHIQSSYAFLNYPELKCDYVRAGVILFGFYSSPNDEVKLKVDLRPVLSLRSRVILLRDIKCGESVGYGRAFTAGRDSRIAMLPIGYADGYPRSLSCGRGYVLINGKKAPVVGRICMDQMTVDVTDIPDVKLGDIVTLIGKDGGEELTAAMVADNTESIANELLSRMGRRLKIVTDRKN